MHLSRTLLAVLASTAAFGSGAIAAPIGGIGVGVGAQSGAAIGAPPIGVPPVHLPPANVPPVNLPKPQANLVPSATNANAGAHGSAQSSSSVDASALHGTVTSVNGLQVAVQLSGSGSAQTFTVSPQTAARLQSYLKRTVVFRVQNGVLTLVGQGTPPLQGTVESVNGSSTQVRLANGATQTYTVTAQQAAWLRTHVGKSFAFWTNAGGTIELDQSSQAPTVSQRQTPKTSH
jgi:hypothetical protein